MTTAKLTLGGGPKPKPTPPRDSGPSSKPVHVKAYDGSKVIVHTIQPGETLGRIAAIYRLKSWRPIHLFNSQVHERLGDDPNQVHEGISIFIPRSPQGYLAAIERLLLTRKEALLLGDKLLKDIGAQQQELETFKSRLDLTSDVLTSVATIGLKAAQAAKAVKALNAAKGQVRIAQHLSTHAISKDFATAFATRRGQLLKPALKAGVGKAAKVAELKKAVGQGAVGWAAKGADAIVAGQTGDDSAAQFETAYKVMITSEKAREAWKAGSALTHLGNATDILLDWLSPSKVAEFYLLATTGETAADAQKTARKTIIASTEKSVAAVDQAIAKLKAEAEFLYA